jgi:hypothetical protein
VDQVTRPNEPIVYPLNPSKKTAQLLPLSKAIVHNSFASTSYSPILNQLVLHFQYQCVAVYQIRMPASQGYWMPMQINFPLHKLIPPQRKKRSPTAPHPVHMAYKYISYLTRTHKLVPCAPCAHTHQQEHVQANTVKIHTLHKLIKLIISGPPETTMSTLNQTTSILFKACNYRHHPQHYTLPIA